MSGYTKYGSERARARARRKTSIRKRFSGTAERPRLSVFRSAKHIYIQAIDDTTNKVIAATSDLDKTIREEAAGKKKKETAHIVGEAIGKKLMDLKVSSVVFDRNGFIYHGRVKEAAEGARKAGLQF